MANNYFSFKQFIIYQDKSAFKVGTDGILLGAVTDIAGLKRILEIGTGTGLIAIMLAQRCEAEIVAIEPDYESYIQACDNVRLCKWNSRIKVEHTDLQNYYPDEEKFDLIVTNPPYFTDSLKNPDPRKSAARHSDSLTSEELLIGVSRLLYDDGHLQLIMPYVEGTVFIAEAQKYGLYCNNILKIKPLPTAEIRRLILSFSRERFKVTEKFLAIEHGKRHEFTEEYINLTKDFYLKF
ncbi:MAG: methyltransferase [Bacteroidia bacterium]|nr:methyltransferase [Bacteroidia bacterium]